MPNHERRLARFVLWGYCRWFRVCFTTRLCTDTNAKNKEIFLRPGMVFSNVPAVILGCGEVRNVPPEFVLCDAPLGALDTPGINCLRTASLRTFAVHICRSTAVPERLTFSSAGPTPRSSVEDISAWSGRLRACLTGYIQHISDARSKQQDNPHTRQG